MRSFIFTKFAESALEEIAAWTVSQFGLDQAEKYQLELLEKCRAIASGDAFSQSCANLLTDQHQKLQLDIQFVRCGAHYIVFQDKPAEVIILDIVHMRQDLAAKLALV